MRATLPAVTPRVYVASPLGFSEPTRNFYEAVLLPAVREAGLEPADPWAGGSAIADALSITNTAERLDALRKANHGIGEANELLIGHSRGVLAVLDGSDVDSGTAAEIGWAAAKGLPIVGWRSDLRQSGDNDAAVVNLQVEYFIVRSGGRIESTLASALANLAKLVGTSG